MKKRIWSFLLVLCLVLTLLPAAALADGTPSVTYAQKTANARTVTATVADAGGADSVKLTATMSRDGKVTETATFEQALDGSGSFDFELPYFGKWDVSAVFTKAGAEIASVTGTAALTADEYNIILGGATTDVAMAAIHAAGYDAVWTALAKAAKNYCEARVRGEVSIDIAFVDGQGHLLGMNEGARA